MLGVLHPVGPVASKRVDRSGPRKNFAAVWHTAWEEANTRTGSQIELTIQTSC